MGLIFFEKICRLFFNVFKKIKQDPSFQKIITAFKRFLVPMKQNQSVTPLSSLSILH